MPSSRPPSFFGLVSSRLVTHEDDSRGLPDRFSGKEDRIAIFLPRWLGDFVMATPTLRAIRRRFGPRARIVGIMRPYLRDVLAGTDWLDEQWYFEPHGRPWLAGHLSILRRIRSAKFDATILMPNSPRSAVLSWLGGAKKRIGYARHGRGPLLTSKLHLPRENGRVREWPMVDYYLRLAEAAGCPPESRRLELATTPEEERSADEVCRQLGLRTDGQLITFNCSGAYGSAKMWPLAHFAELARRVVDELDHDVLVMCGPAERGHARIIARLAGRTRVFSMDGQPLDIGTAKACVRRSRLMVSTDSGPRHLAAALGKAVMTLYGPLLPLWGCNPTVQAIDLYLKDLDCIGCHARTCPQGHHRCMRELSVDMVYRPLAAWLNRNSTCAV